MSYTNLEEILKQVDIVDVISQYIDLERKGKNFFGVCPFHDDTTPSMSVSQEKQIYKCFSCGAAGDALTFIKDYENIDFKSSLVKLAGIAGVEVNVQERAKPIDNYFKIYEKTTQLFSYALLHVKENQKYLSYLSSRKFSIDTIKKFSLGVSDSRAEKFLRDNFDNKDIAATNLINSNGNLMFRSRIMFPISNHNGYVVAFSGRVIDNSNPKYINSSETKHFIKGQVLYNYHNAKEFCKKEKSIIITEGFFDTMRLVENGVNNVVATMGTSFTNEHAKLVSDLVDKVYLCLDGDMAGLKASYMIYQMLLNSNLDIMMVNLGDYDPDEYVLQNGIEKFNEILRSSKVYEEFYIDYITKHFSTMSIQKKQDTIERVVNFVNGIKNDYRRQLIAEYASDKTALPINYNRSIESDVPKQQYVENKSSRKKGVSIAKAYYEETVSKYEAINKCELEFLQLMYRYPKYIEKYIEDIKAMNIKENDVVAMLIKENYVIEEFANLNDCFTSHSKDYSELEQKRVREIIAIVEASAVIDEEELLYDLIYKIITFKYDAQIDIILEQLQNSNLCNEEKIELIEKIRVLKHRRQNIMESRGF